MSPEWLLRAPRGAMLVVRARDIEAAALIGAKTWPDTPFMVYPLDYFQWFQAETETLVKGVRHASV